MKKSATVTLVSFFMLVLVVVFSTTLPASAHDGGTYTTTAQQASEMNTKQAMMDFVLHVKEHREQLRSYDEHAEFRNAMRTSGTWKSGTTDVITVNRASMGLLNLRAGEVISFHAEDDDALDGSLRHIGIFDQLMMELEKPGQGEQPACVTDDTGDHGNHICAVQTTITSDTGVQNIVYTVAGFHHEPDDVDDSKALDACRDLGTQYFSESGTDSNGESFPRVNAQMLDMSADRETLKNYTKTVEEHISNEIKNFRNLLRMRNPGYDQRFSEEEQRGHITGRLVRLRPCWRQPAWKAGSIYFVLFRHEDKRYSVFNGLSPALKDSTLDLYDGCVDVDQLIVQALKKQDENNRFFEYYWSNPVKDDDLVVDEDGKFIQGLSPGTSLKTGYVLPTTFGGETKANFVILSGIYPEDREQYVPEGGMCHPIPDNLSAFARDQLHRYPGPGKDDEDDGGCAIASGDQGNIKVAGFNLFLLTVVLFFASLGKRRSGGKFWTPKL